MAISIIYLMILLVLGVVAVALLIVTLATGLVTHPIRTLAFLLSKAAGLVAGLGLFLAVILWFWCDHGSKDWGLDFWCSIAMMLAAGIVCRFAEWIMNRPTRAERRAVEQQDNLMQSKPQEVTNVYIQLPADYVRSSPDNEVPAE